MPPELPSLVLLSLLAAAMITTQVVGIVRDMDWWVITRDVTRGHTERLARSLRRPDD